MRTVIMLSEKQHPDKTLVGRTDRGFDFLGYRFEPGSLSVVDQTFDRFKERIARLYEQVAGGNTLTVGLSRWVVG